MSSASVAPAAATAAPRPVRPVAAVLQPSAAPPRPVTSASSLLARKLSTSSSSSSSSSSSALRTPTGSPDLSARSYLSAHSGSSSQSHSRKHSLTALLHPARPPTAEDDVQAIPARLRSSPLILCAASPFYRLSHPSEHRSASSSAASSLDGSRPSSPTRLYSAERDRACALASTEDELKRVLDGMLFPPPHTSPSSASYRPRTPSAGAVAAAGRRSSS